ncbi:MAG TPA: c-type cytochrome [Rhizomicrobium sp.]|jgi:putative heme-binding domain-containing protein|nr:c-type cytochrome [Rhizomicrobium sp.]
MKRAILVASLIAFSALPAAAQRRATPSGPPNPFWGNSAAITQGEQIYNKNCTACHGVNGGAGEIGPAIVLDMSTPLRGERNDFQVVQTIRDGVPGTAMPAWKGKLADDDILKIGAYIHSLRGTAIDNPLPGNVAHGEQIFWGKGQCGTCHTINGRGGLIGPDLSDIAGKRKSNSIIDALTKAQHRIYGDGGVHLPSLPPMDTYDAVHLVLTDGQTIDGVLLNQDGYSLQVMGTDNHLHLLDREKVRDITVKPPLMPTDYDKRLTPDEFKDLMAFLTRQGFSAPPAPTGGRAAAPDPD